MGITIRFVGGPADGCTHKIPDSEPPPLYLITVDPPLSDLWTSPLEAKPIQKAVYKPLLDGGWLRRADDGAYLYRHQSSPVTPEAREALERGRREARAAKEQRDAELDASWREIRRERPHYPADWRDIWRNR
ncbi:hypothetical protein [Streptomyces lasiicapitis]|uniref:hypothetical protein n=1 Tax=Streptomyces lasiicapitis TaxID=1923961 RepID=UPI0036920B8F